MSKPTTYNITYFSYVLQNAMKPINCLKEWERYSRPLSLRKILIETPN